MGEPDTSVLTRHRIKGRWQQKVRTWRQRRVREMAAWDKLITPLTAAYLHYVYKDHETNTTPETELSAPAAGTHISIQSTEPLEYTVDAYDIYSPKTTEITVNRLLDSTSPALDLMRHGYLTKTPQRPEVAVSLRTLELLYRLRQRKPSYSIEAYAKVLADFYQVS